MLYNYVSEESHIMNYQSLKETRSIMEYSKISVTSSGVSDSLKKVILGKSASIDGLAAEHLVYSHERISVHLAMFLQVC